jgi:hypothetical protein
MTTLAERGPAKLPKSEQARIRSAADALSDRLVDSRRRTAERARRLTDDLGPCGPGRPMARAAAL